MFNREEKLVSRNRRSIWMTCIKKSLFIAVLLLIGVAWCWALLKPETKGKNISVNKIDCVGCHNSEKNADRVFRRGYAAIR